MLELVICKNGVVKRLYDVYQADNDKSRMYKMLVFLVTQTVSEYILYWDSDFGATSLYNLAW